jgi:hypothetical protein
MNTDERRSRAVPIWVHLRSSVFGDLSRFTKRGLWFLGLLAFSCLLTGCVQQADWAAVQRQAGTPAGDLFGSHTVGQTLVPSHNGLCAIEVLLVDYGAESNRSAAPLEFRLCRDLACQDVITQTALAPEAISHNAPFVLRCPPQPDSAGRTYLLQVSAPQAMIPARATVWAHDADYYPDGTLLRDGLPAAGDLDFTAFYDLGAGQIASTLWNQAAGSLEVLPALLLLLLAPGYLLARLLPRGRQNDVLDLISMVLGLSVAAVPVLLLLLSLPGPLLSGPAVRIGGAVLALAVLALLALDLRRGRWRGLCRVPGPVWLALVGIVAIGLVLRAVHALDLLGPPWVDAVHHTLLSRLIVERAAIPGDYFPYVEVAPATYHFGFQSLVAVLHHLTGRPLQDCLLLLGQLLSGLTALPLYALGKRWSQSRWGGLLAAAVPSALSLLPAYYVSWSRYTELTGLFLIPLAVLLLERWLLRPRWHWGLGGVTAIVLAGLLATHLRVAAFLAVLAVLLVLEATLHWRYRLIWVPWARGLAVALAAAILVWPWLGPSIQHLWLPAAQSWPAAQETFSLYYVLYGPGRYLAPVVAVGAALGLLWRRRETLLLALWCGVLPILANPQLVGLQPGGPLERLIPGLHLGAMVDDTAVAIAMYLPVSLAAALAGGGIARFVRWVNGTGARPRWARALAKVPQRLQQWLDGWKRHAPGHSGQPRGNVRGWRWAAAVLLVLLCGWGAYQLREIVNARTVILTAPDLEAMAWIRENTAADAVFLINSYEWMPNVYAGTDGGYWISPLTGRRSWPPPALYGLGTGTYIAEINSVAQAAMESTDGETLHTLLRTHAIDYVYLGRYGGNLQPEVLLAYPDFQLVYHQEGVWIFVVAAP